MLRRSADRRRQSNPFRRRSQVDPRTREDRRAEGRQRPHPRVIRNWPAPSHGVRWLYSRMHACYFLYSATVEERFIDRAVPGHLPGVQALDEDARALHLLSWNRARNWLCGSGYALVDSFARPPEMRESRRCRGAAQGLRLRARTRQRGLVRCERTRCRVVVRGQQGREVRSRTSTATSRSSLPSSGSTSPFWSPVRPASTTPSRTRRRSLCCQGNAGSSSRGGATAPGLGLLPLAGDTVRPRGAVPRVRTRGAVRGMCGRGDVRPRTGVCERRVVPATAAALLESPPLGVGSFKRHPRTLAHQVSYLRLAWRIRTVTTELSSSPIALQRARRRAAVVTR